MSKTVLVLVETVDEYLPMLEQAGYHLSRAPSPQLMPFSAAPKKSIRYSPVGRN